MGIHKHEPCPIDEMDRSHNRFSICEVLRQIWLRIKDGNDNELKELNRIAMTMVRSMNVKLNNNHKNWATECDFYDEQHPLMTSRLGRVENRERCKNCKYLFLVDSSPQWFCSYIPMILPVEFIEKCPLLGQ